MNYRVQLRFKPWENYESFDRTYVLDALSAEDALAEAKDQFVREYLVEMRVVRSKA